MPNLFPIAAAGLLMSVVWADTTLAQDLEAGQALAEKSCGRCHATGVRDKSTLATAPPFRVLPSRYTVLNLAEALAEGIVTGHSEMPEFTLDPEEIGNLLAYIDWLGAQIKTQ